MGILQLLSKENEKIKEEDSAFYVFTNYLYFICLIIHFSLLAAFAILGIKIMAIYNIFSCIIFAWILNLNKKGELKNAHNIALSEIIIHAGLATVCLGLESNFLFYSIGVCISIMFSSLFDLRTKVIEASLTTVFFIIAYLLMVFNEPIYRLNTILLSVTGTINIILIICLLSYMSLRYFNLNMELNRKLKETSEIDELTGAYNRRFFDEYIEIEVKRSLNQINYKLQDENQINFGIAVIDIDKFKTINDTYGHMVGDNVLKQVVQIIKNTTFSRDLVCRYGGDEFIILFTKTSKAGAIKAVEKIRKEVDNNKFYFTKEKNAEHLTISIGFASFDDICNNEIESIFQVADNRLCTAKSEGRNRVVYG